MFRRNLLIAMLALVLLPAPQAYAQDASRPGNLLVRMPWARLEIVFGRLRLTRCRLGQESQISANLPEQGIAETLAFSAKTTDSARLRYEYADTEQQLRVDVEQAAQVSVERLPRGESKSARVRLQQPVARPADARPRRRSKRPGIHGGRPVAADAGRARHLSAAPEPDLAAVAIGLDAGGAIAASRAGLAGAGSIAPHP